MFYELKEKLIINLDKINTIQKIIYEDTADFILEIRFDVKDSRQLCSISYNSIEELENEYKQIKERLIEIYG